MADRDELEALRAENARLIALLESHGIEWRASAGQSPPVERIGLSPEEKIALFRRLFRGRGDVHAVRWESKTTGKSGYAPACANDKFARGANLHSEAARRARAMDGPSEWRVGVCEKPRIKCADCGNRSFIPLAEAAIYRHLVGEHMVGVYPLLDDNSFYFLAVDFDEAEWRDDARAFMRSCE